MRLLPPHPSDAPARGCVRSTPGAAYGQAWLWQLVYSFAQCAATHDEHAVLPALAHSVEQLDLRHAVNVTSGPEAVGQLWTMHFCSQSEKSTSTAPPPAPVPPLDDELAAHVWKHDSVVAHVAAPVPNMSWFWKQ